MKSTPRPGPARKLSGRFAVWLLVFGVAGGLLCVTPLFNVLGFESSLVVALLASVAAVFFGAQAVVRSRQRLRPADRDPRQLAPLRLVLSLWTKASVATWAMCLLPLGLLIANGLRVRNCNYLSGLHFYLLLPGLSAVLGAGLGVLSALVSRSLGRGLVLGYGVIIGSILWAILRSLSSPAVFAYDPFFGYFPGALYDEDVRVQPALYAARAEQVLLLLGALFASARFLSGRDLRVELSAVAPRRGLLLILSLVFFFAGGTLYVNGGRLGIYADETALAERLPGQLETPHFVLRYRPGGPVERDLALYAREHELRYAQLREELGVEPNWQSGLLPRLLGFESSLSRPRRGQPVKVVSYLFDSVPEKRRGMGAGGTYIAKPWRREIYIQHEAWPHPVLRHELAHVFAGAAGDRLFRLSLSGVIPQLGLVEGLAVAADRRVTGNVSLHQSVRAMRQAGLLPPLEQVFSGLRFWSLPSGRAYTAAGSFVRYLMQQHGPQKVLAAYHDGGRPSDFARIFGTPFPELTQRWLDFVEAQPLPPEAREVERERQRRPAVFHKVCAHELAVRRDRARELHAQGRASDAVALLESVCRDDPGEPSYLWELADAQLGAEQQAAAESTLRRAIDHPATTQTLRGRLLIRLGDLAALAGQLDAARKSYDEAAALPLDEGSARTLSAKRLALDLPEAGAYLRSVLIGRPKSASGLRRDERSDVVNAFLLGKAADAAPQSGLVRYVLGRLLFQRGGYAESIAELSRSLTLGLPDRRFAYQAKQLIGQAQLLLDQGAAAQTTFDELLSWLGPDEEDKRTETLDFAERSRRWSILESAD